MTKRYSTNLIQNNSHNSDENIILEQFSQKVKKLVESSHKDILHIHTVFPFKFFTDELIINPIKVTLIHRIFFFSEQVKSILIDNIRSVTTENGPFFSTLTIIDNIPTQTIISIKPIMKPNAQKVKNLLEGMIISKKSEVDLAEQKAQILEKIGKGNDEL